MAIAHVALIPGPVADGAVLTEREVSELTGVRLSTLRYLWLNGDGPAYIEEHSRVRCTVADVLKWQRLRAAMHARLMASYRQCSR